MRIKVLFQNNEPTELPINYNYYLSSAIYEYLNQSDAEYAFFLHEEGYTTSKGKRFKLFTFSQLQAKKRQIVGDKIRFTSSVTWYVSSPSEDFLGNFAAALLERRQLNIAETKVMLKDLFIPKPPRFSERMRFTCLSPITISTVAERNGERILHYCRPDEADFYEKIQQNLIGKYEVLYGKLPPKSDSLASLEDKFRMEFDPEYVKKHNGRITKLVKFKDIDVIGVMAPFTIEADPRLIELGYECGFGDKNSAGFGMVEVCKRR